MEKKKKSMALAVVAFILALLGAGAAAGLVFIPNLGAGFEAVAWADDGCVEAITPVEGIEKRFVVGLQWHPERIQDQPPQEKIFQAFIQSV